jgi:hypothetical protein
VDLVVTLASLLGINQPSHAAGRVLTEALATVRAEKTARSDSSRGEHLQPEALPARGQN